MAIKNKDGTLFKLVGPNPIMKNQDFWKEEILHNFDFEERTTGKMSDKEREEDPNVMKILISDEDEYEDFDDVEPQEIEVPIKEMPVPKPKPKSKPKHKPPKQETPKPKQEIKVPKLEARCLPAVVNKYNDTLYGEVRKRVAYGTTFNMELVLVEFNDLYLKGWTNMELGEESIVFIPSQKRWWKVDNSYEGHGGYIFVCSPSPITPSFQ